MPKAYWVVAIQQVDKPEQLVEYSKLAGPAIAAAGGRILARGTAQHAYEAGQLARTVVTEFPSLEQALAAREGAAYQAALKVLGDAAKRDFRIVEGVE
ncbi:DUF1330 domain-containing protein [Burkholderia sp. Ac-20379]|uniref:DUF1330 domain-containing protein n=1 Tax=Burkholderia sp. Ac-20379 TaxID=2703900 RepID=UPI00197CC261|nr:DUF1330 domain-containing protein [Burkholderia sp. Ac-20379]MBN3727327.1 DUF1330 domain-containing protein [Burkholderia sp. Ac-20379]